MVLHISDFDPDCSRIRDIPVPSSNDVQEENIGYISTQKHLHPRTEEETVSPNEDNGGDDQDNAELARKKRAKKNNSETEADYSSSLSDYCFVAHVTAWNLDEDALYLPKYFTSLNGLERESRDIFLTDEGENSWALELRFDVSSETFYINRGWRCFCDVNGKKAGDFFVFKLLENGEIPVLSFRPTESGSGSNRRQRECSEASGRKSLSTELISEEKSSEDECSSLGMEKKKNRLTLTLSPFNVLDGRLRLPIKFTRENDINKPGMITLLGKDHIKQQVKLLVFDKKSGAMSLGDGWKDFVKASGLKAGDSFTLELIWEDTSPVLTLCPEVCRVLTSPSQNVTLTVTHASLRKSRLHLPSSFVRVNGITEPGMITLLGKNGTKWLASLLQDCRGAMTLGNGWKDFAEANGLKTGVSFTFESLWENATPMLRLLGIDSTSDRTQQGECSKAIEKESIPAKPSGGNTTRKAKNKREVMRDSTSIPTKLSDGNTTKKAKNMREERRDSTSIPTKPSDGNTTNKAKKKREEMRDSTSPIQNRFVTATVTHDSLRKCRLHLPSSFTRENGITRPGMITLLGKDSTKWPAKLLQDYRGAMSLGNGWKEFAEANGLKIGESFTFESIWENENPMLRLFRTQQGECSKASEIESVPTKPCDGNTTKKAENNREESRDPTSPIQNRFVTLTLTNYSLKRHRLHLPLSFVRENGSIKPGMITLLGKDGRKWLVSLLQDYGGSMSLGNGWKDFAEANVLKIGESFTFESIWENENPILRLFRTQQGECSKASEKESVPTKPSDGSTTKKAENNREESRDSTSPIQNRFATLTLTNDSLKKQRLHLPLSFVRENGLIKPGTITLLGKDGTKWLARLLQDYGGSMSLGNGWKDFAEANGLKIGEPFTFEAIWENATPMLSLKMQEGECSKASEKESISTEPMSLGNGWKDFGEANGLKIGESFTFESIWENATPMLSLFGTESTSEKMQEGETEERREDV